MVFVVRYLTTSGKSDFYRLPHPFVLRFTRLRRRQRRPGYRRANETFYETINPNVAEKAAHITGKPSWRKVLGLIAMVHSLAPWVLSCPARADGHPVVEKPHGFPPSRE